MKSQPPFLCTLLCLILSACGAESDPALPTSTITLALASPAFSEGQPIPAQYTCDGGDTSPALAWGDPPGGTLSFVLIVDDSDAGGFVHWLIFNIPAGARTLDKGIPAQTELSDGARQGKNGWRESQYGGPCPSRVLRDPPGGTHHYVFALYALDTLLDVQPGASRNELVEAMQGHVLAQGVLTGTYTR